MSFLTKRFKGDKVSAAQLDIMLGFLEKNTALISGKLSANFTSADRKQGWEKLAAQLNSCGVGPQKNVDRWRKCWTDQKCLARAKAARIRTHTQITGGPTKERLNDLEERILKICGTMCSSGNDNIQESGLTQCSTSQTGGGLANEDLNLNGIESASSEEMEKGTSNCQETPKVKEEEVELVVPEIIRIESISTLNTSHSLQEAADTPIPSTSTVTTLTAPPRFSFFNYSMRKKKDPSSTVKAAAAIEETNAEKIKYYQEKLELKKKLFEFKKTEHQLQLELLKEKISFVQAMVKAVKTSINISNFMLD